MFYFSDEQRKIVVLLKDIGSKKNKLVQVGSNLFFYQFPYPVSIKIKSCFYHCQARNCTRLFVSEKEYFFLKYLN